MYSWSSADDKILIEFVRMNEALFDKRSKDYRKTQLKQNLWREIGTVLNKTDFECSKRWCYVRDYYIRRKGKPGTGSSGEAAKKRSDLLSFLDHLPSHRNSIGGAVRIENLGDNSYEYESIADMTMKDENQRDRSVTEENLGDSGEIMENTMEANDETLFFKQEIDPMAYDDTGEIQDSNNCDDINNVIVNRKGGNTKSEKKRKTILYAQERTHKQIAHRKHLIRNELDETDLFFSSMAKIVKKLPRYEQAQLRIQIGSLVGNAELSYISNDSSQSSFLSPRPSTSASDFSEA